MHEKDIKRTKTFRDIKSMDPELLRSELEQQPTDQHLRIETAHKYLEEQNEKLQILNKSTP